jgi:hypothetical protein
MGMDVRAWARGGGQAAPKVPRKALERLEALPESKNKPGRVEHPFPLPEEDSPYDKRMGHKSLQKRIAAAPVRKVPLDKLVSNGQKTVALGRVSKYIADPGAPGTHQGGHHEVDRPIVVKVGGQDVLYDGHHRATAAWCLGEKDIAAHVVDLDGPAPKK